jgi:hypothetical protein
VGDADLPTVIGYVSLSYRRVYQISGQSQEASPFRAGRKSQYGVSLAVALDPCIVSAIYKGPTLEYYREYKRANELLSVLGARVEEFYGKCMKCAEVCPGKAVLGDNWNVNIDRDSFFNAHSCYRVLNMNYKCSDWPAVLNKTFILGFFSFIGMHHEQKKKMGRL